MKRIISLSLAIIFALSLCFSVSADSTNNNTITIDHYTIIFDENSSLTQEEKIYLAEIRANHHEHNGETSTYGVMCNVFGHKTTTETIAVIEHCVSDTQPRCVKTYEDMTVCSRCDYVQIDVISSAYIFCCD